MTKLYTDTSANLPLALLREYDIAVIPFSYTVNGVAEDYNEETDFDGKAFYDAMRRGAEVKTSMVNPATAAAFFERALAQGDDVLYVGMSGGIGVDGHNFGVRIFFPQLLRRERRGVRRAADAAGHTYKQDIPSGLQQRGKAVNVPLRLHQ